MELSRKFDTHRITTESTYSEILTRTGLVPNENDKHWVNTEYFECTVLYIVQDMYPELCFL